MKAVVVHKRIKIALKKLTSDYPNDDGFYIIRIAREAKTNTRTVVHHLEILEENDTGRFLDPDKKVFALYSQIRRRELGVQMELKHLREKENQTK